MLPIRIHQGGCKIMKRPVSVNTLMKNIEFKTLNTNNEMRNHPLSYDALILEDNFHDV